MKKLFGKIAKRRRLSGGVEAGPSTPVGILPNPITVPLPLPAERDRLHKLAGEILPESISDINDGHEQYPVDIIAIHGLNGHPFTTWTHENGTLWLKDLLPGQLPGCRVYTYGYPSQVLFSKSLMEVREYARSLLDWIRSEVLSDDNSGYHVCLAPIPSPYVFIF